MTSNNEHHDPGDRFDWDRAEAEVTGTGPDTDGADVVDLDAERDRRQADTDPDTAPDSNTDAVTGALVDSIAAQRRPRFHFAGLRDAERRPIVPGWLKSKSEFVGNLGWAVGLSGHTLAYHGIRTPKYALKLAIRAPRGAGRVVGGFTGWVTDWEGEPVRRSVVRAASTDPDEAEAYLKLSRQRDRRVRWRSIVAAGVLFGVLLTAGALLLAPEWFRWALLAVLVAVCGVIGRPTGKPLLDTAVVASSVSPLTSDEVILALASLNIGGINRALSKGDNGKRWFPAPITRENGTGWRADVELPRGVTASSVVDKREELAAALTRPLGCVWPEANGEVHPGRLTLFVADKDLARAKPYEWPLAKAGRVNLFKPFPFGVDPRGRVVSLTLMFASMIIGSIPRMGKTFLLRLVMLAACLDVRSWLLLFDLKGTGDLSPLEICCHRYRAGDEDEDIEYGIVAMREIRAELRRRTKVIRELPRDICPENKVTDELANIKSLGLHPIVIGVDECQVWFEHAKYGAEFEEICTDLVKRGPAAGISLVLATQRPDAKSLPVGISANAVLRFCLKVMGWRENNMVLGDGMFDNGIKATMFSRRDRGIGYLAGEGDDPTIAKGAYVDAPGAERIAIRARAMREKAGNLTGHAAGVVLDTTTVTRDTLLEDVIAVMGDNEPKLWSEVILERLAELRPEVYGQMTRDQLTAALKPHKVTPVQVWATDPTTGKGANRRGIERQHIFDAITRRDRDQGGKAAS